MNLLYCAVLTPVPRLQVRYRRDHLSGRTLQHFPLLDDLLKDVCDGAALLAVIHFYCPELIRLEGTATTGFQSRVVQNVGEIEAIFLNFCGVH